MRWHHYTSIVGLENILEDGSLLSYSEQIRKSYHLKYSKKIAEQKFNSWVAHIKNKEEISQEETRRKMNVYLTSSLGSTESKSEEVIITIESRLRPNLGDNFLEVPKLSLDKLVGIGVQPEHYKICAFSYISEFIVGISRCFTVDNRARHAKIIFIY